MHSEWMKVMLAEIERKREETRSAEDEELRRARERQAARGPDPGSNGKTPARKRR
jgi:hypothetical protein